MEFNFNIESLINFVKLNATDYSLRLLAAIVIFYIGKYAARFLSGMFFRAMTRTHMDATLAGFLRNVIYALLFAMVIIAALNALGIQTTSLVAMMGAAGLAVGLSLKDQISNFGSGVLIVMLRPFRVGDYVTIAGQTGSVLTIEVFQTILKTVENLTIIIPNSKVMSGDITNYSLQGTRMIPLLINIGYNCDLKKAKDTLLDIMTSHPNVIADPAPRAGVQELNDSSVRLFAQSWVETPNWTPTRAELLETIKIRFGEEGINIPNQQLDVYLRNKDTVN